MSPFFFHSRIFKLEHCCYEFRELNRLFESSILFLSGHLELQANCGQSKMNVATINICRVPIMM